VISKREFPVALTDTVVTHASRLLSVLNAGTAAASGQ